MNASSRSSYLSNHQTHFKRKYSPKNLLLIKNFLCQIRTNSKLGTNSLYLQSLESIFKMRTLSQNEE